MAREAVRSLAETIDDPVLQEQFLNAAFEQMPREKPLSLRRVEAEKFGGLTLRERQVIAQIAQGKSNREIADSLFLSERTIEIHVRNVLSKLGFRSRAQIAAWAVEKGLAKSKVEWSTQASRPSVSLHNPRRLILFSVPGANSFIRTMYCRAEKSVLPAMTLCVSSSIVRGTSLIQGENNGYISSTHR